MIARFFIVLALLFFPGNLVAADTFGFWESGQKYGVNPGLLEAISAIESNHNQQAINQNISKEKNKLMSTDYTHMQINDLWWKKKVDEIDSRLWAAMLHCPKTATEVGAWIVSQYIARYGNTWHAVAAYNTGRSINLDDCLSVYDSYRKRHEYTTKQLAKAQQRVERGRAYARKIFLYMRNRGYIQTATPIPDLLKISKKTTLAKALPMRKTINTAQYRRPGTWRLIND
ncbi:lytic transglycosylase domain-containing protein [Pseudodesulfovibrio senegalensis]|uniref:Lytic transglycosylase domain-containing protein n=1 Tax=Pseudodesulfovibrio senegalensis TaxID=1721087 RepID=A0A6N6N092_9BACT|nr:lytic transglycosylase domain-containing protein [Pseudodesulfovibrio senegalensis]KAB1437308.1 lytic transglycosylase domain-containing protein [Pseudodesulfovibrio senegalensis]